MSEIPPPANPPSPTNPNEAWRNFTVTSPIGACKVTRDDLKRLYRLINEKEIEHRDRVLPRLSRTEQESAEAFNARVTAVRDAFITTVRITGANGQVVTGHGEDVFDSPLLPERIVSISYDTSFSPTAILKYTPSDRATVLLDFSQPKPLSMAVQPSAPTPNNSNFFVTAEMESWSTSLTTRLREFFTERGTSINWLHAPATYDALLFPLGLPFALWEGYHLGSLIVNSNWPSPLIFALYVYTFLFFLNIFRCVFMYARWIYPKIELAGGTSSAQNTHKAILTIILLGILASAIWDGIKSIFR
jgi:hypothetical protein